MPVLPLLKFRNYFITSEGSVFKIVDGKEERVKTFKTKRSKEIHVLIDGKYYNLLHLMLQHFHGTIKGTAKIKFTITKDLTIPANSIIIKPALGLMGISKHDEALLVKYKCDLKCSSANSRCEQKLTPVQVFTSLQIHEFKCVYCGYEFPPKNWHLDHFQSISRGGKNILENIVPACDVCNIMKGPMEGHQFYAQCRKIFQNYMFKDSLGENYTLKTA